MKKLIAISLILCCAYVSNAQQEIFIPGYDKEIDDEPRELFPSYEIVYSNRELPRSFTIPYPDEHSAREGSLTPSLYLQPMDEKPAVTDTGDRIEYTWTYKVPFAWVGRMVSVYVESVDNPYTVIINGEQTGYNQSSRSPAEFEITAVSKEGINTLTISVAKSPAVQALTGAVGSGTITGKVLVISQPRIRVRDYVYEVNYSAEEPTLQLGIILKTNTLNPRAVRLHYSLRDMEGITVSSGHRDAEVGLKEEDTVRFFIAVPELKPWSYETPNLYNLTIKNQYEGRYTEYVNYRTGFRNFDMNEGKLYSNGYEVPLSFYMMEQVPAKDRVKGELSRIKSEGYNIVVVPKYPQSEEFYRACDSLGLYVCNQADINTGRAGDSRAEGANPANDPRWADSFVDRAVTMYGNSATHPSVAMFSIARGSSNGYNLYESYIALKAMEPRRAVIYPEAEGEWNSDAVTDAFARDYPKSVGSRLILSPSARRKVYGEKPVVKLNSTSPGYYTITNNALATNLRGHLLYQVKKGKKVIASGTIPVSLEPGQGEPIQIPVPEEFAGKKVKYEVTLKSNFDGLL